MTVDPPADHETPDLPRRAGDTLALLAGHAGDELADGGLTFHPQLPAELHDVERGTA